MADIPELPPDLGEKLKDVTAAANEASTSVGDLGDKVSQTGESMKDLGGVSSEATSFLKEYGAEIALTTAAVVSMAHPVGRLARLIGPKIKGSLTVAVTALSTALGVATKAMGGLFKTIASNVIGFALNMLGKYVGLLVKLPIRIYLSAFKKAYEMSLTLGQKLFEINKQFLEFMDNATASFFQQTQAAAVYTKTLDDSIDALRNQGLAIGEVGSNAAALFKNTVLFRDASISTRKELLVFTSVLEQAGVGAEDTSRMVQILNKTIGDGGIQTRATTERIIQFARAAGISGATAAAEFGNAATVIAAHGEGMEQVFKDLVTQSRATGLGIGDLITIAAQFDTFEKSASAVGRLNAMLGGPFLNSVQMVYATESERNRAILESIELSGKSFSSMGRFERQAIAAAVGITDMAQATEFFGGGLAAFDKAAQKAEENKDRMNELADIARQATTIFDNFKNALMSLAVSFRPQIEGVRRLLEGFAGLNKQTDGAIGRVGLLIGGVGMLTKTFGPLGFAGSIAVLASNWNKVEELLGPKGVQLLNTLKDAALQFALQIPKVMNLIGTKIMEVWSQMTATEGFQTFKANFMAGLINMYTTMIPIIKKVAMGIILPIASELMVELGRALEAQQGLGFIGKGLTGAGQMIQSVATARTTIEGQQKLIESFKEQSESIKKQTQELKNNVGTRDLLGELGVPLKLLDSSEDREKIKQLEAQNRRMQEQIVNSKEMLGYMKSIKENGMKAVSLAGGTPTP